MKIKNIEDTNYNRLYYGHLPQMKKTCNCGGELYVLHTNEHCREPLKSGFEERFCNNDDCCIVKCRQCREESYEGGVTYYPLTQAKSVFKEYMKDKIGMTVHQAKQAHGDDFESFTCSFRCLWCQKTIFFDGNLQDTPVKPMCPFCGKLTNHPFGVRD